MNELDCRILQALQDEFPLSLRPYDVLAKKLHIPPDQLWERTQRLIGQGLIRRLGASLDSRKLGFTSTLAAVSVQPELVEQAAKVIEQFPEVTHSYLRKDHFNIWFTIIAPDNKKIEGILEQIRSTLSLGKAQILNLPMKRLFKLDTRFNISP